MEVIAQIVVVVMCVSYGVWVGYEWREWRFQNRPITFIVGGQNSIWVDNQSGPKTKIKIYDKKLIEQL